MGLFGGGRIWLDRGESDLTKEKNCFCRLCNKNREMSIGWGLDETALGSVC